MDGIEESLLGDTLWIADGILERGALQFGEVLEGVNFVSNVVSNGVFQ